MKPTLTIGNAVVYHGNNLDVLPTLPDNSVDSIVCDPPYELGFMGKKWDSSGIAYSVELWTECMRVLKPGGHLLAFGGSRTWHRLAVAIEDAGFEIRDSIAWLYGSGFPKSMNVSKAIEGLLTTGSSQKNNFHQLPGEKDTNVRIGMWDSSEKQGFRKKNPEQLGSFDLEPATDEAKQWAGWGTALKPAFEPVVVARKPLIGTVAENVLTWGVGGLNIDGSRIGTEQVEAGNAGRGTGHKTGTFQLGFGVSESKQTSQGRWPANIILDEYTAGLLDEQSGISTSRPVPPGVRTGNFLPSDERSLKAAGIFGAGAKSLGSNHNDSGGASRFFYVAKASKKDRNEGLEELPTRRASALGYDIGLGEAGEGMFKDRNPQKQNFHPTVKPTAIMEYLIKLVTPPNGTVLDPFTGSGSTGKAALLNGFKFIGIELTKEYLPIIEGRLTHASQAKEEESETLF